MTREHTEQALTSPAHTQGPWLYQFFPEWEEPGFGVYVEDFSAPDMCIAMIAYQAGLGDDGDTTEAARKAAAEANARLIAAAPDMLAALRLAHRHPERQHEPGEMPTDCVICAAIARATGGEG